MPARLLRVILLVTALIVTPSLAQSLVTKIDQQVPSNVPESDPQGRVIVRVDETNLPFPPFSQGDKLVLHALLVETEDLLRTKDPDQRDRKADSLLDGLEQGYGPVFVATFQSSLGAPNVPLALSPQFIQLVASQISLNGRVRWNWEQSAKSSSF